MTTQALTNFTFEDCSVRVFGDFLNPLFVASDVCKALGIVNTSDALKALTPFEKTTVKVIQKNPRSDDPRLNLGSIEKTVNAVTESGLYTLILRCRDAVKEGTFAYRFRVWVTSEVLPSIRKQGFYQCPAPSQDKTLSPAEQFSIRNAVGKKAKKSPSTYRFIYSLLKQRFQVARYSQISTYDFREALNFIKELKLPAPYSEPLPAPARTPAEYDDEDQTYKLTISRRELERFGTFIYNWRYQFHDALVLYVNHLVAVKSPYSRKLYDATFDSSLQQLEELFREHGISIGPDLPNPERLRTLAYSI